MDKLLDLLNSLELYEDSAKTLDLAEQMHSLFNNIEFPYRNIENMPDIYKRHCPNPKCKGLLFLDKVVSFSVHIYDNIVLLDVSKCDECGQCRIETIVKRGGTMTVGNGMQHTTI